MKRRDLNVSDDVAAKLLPNSWSTARIIERATVRHIGERKVVVQPHSKPLGETQEVSLQHIVMPWEDYVIEREAEQAARDRLRKREMEAWERKRADERERFEQHILPAFKGLSCTGYVSGRLNDPTVDLADYIEDMILTSGSSTVQFREADLRAVADRITVLQAIAEQTALTTDDLPQAGWGIPPTAALEPQDDVTVLPVTPEEDADLERELRRDGGAA